MRNYFAFFIFLTSALGLAEGAGDVDLSFGSGGVQLTTVAGHPSAALQSLIQEDGKTLVLGFTDFGYSSYLEHTADPNVWMKQPKMVLARYSANGALDTSFGSGGFLVSSFGNHSVFPKRMALVGGKILVVGSAVRTSTSGHADLFMARLNPDGSLDGTFGNRGTVLTGFFDSGRTKRNESANDVIVLGDGKILVAGDTPAEVRCTVYMANGPKESTCVLSYFPALVRYLPNGALDTFFGEGGRKSLVINAAEQATIARVKLDANGNLMAVWGSLYSRIVRLFPDGTIDRSFGPNGDGFVYPPRSVGADIALQQDGAILYSATRSGLFTTGAATFNGFVQRYLANGTLDLGFGNGGETLTTSDGTFDSATSLAVQPDRRIVVAGKRIEGDTYIPVLVRLNQDGSRDSSFGNQGSALLPGTLTGCRVVDGMYRLDYCHQDVALQSDGKIWSAGTLRDGTNSGLGTSRVWP